MKNLKLVVLLSLTIIMFSSCSKEDGSVDLTFKAQYDGEPLVLSQDYIYPDGKAMYFSRFSFYMSDLTLRTDENFAQNDQISYLNIGQQHTTTALADIGYVYTLKDVKPGNYVNLSFNVGVPAEQNAMTPTDFSSNDDLSLSGEYWSGWESYIFCKVEGVIDFDGDGIPESDFALHLGADEALANIEIDKDFEVKEGDKTTVTIPIELKNFFLDGDQLYDIVNNPKIHNLSQNDKVLELASNLKNCF